MRAAIKLAACLALIWPSGTQAQSACLPHEEAVAKLKQHYGEQKVGLGIGPGGQSVLELFVSETGTWTVLVTRPNGLSCITMSGDGWITSPVLRGEPL